MPEPRESEPDISRPVLVVQAGDFNRSRINTVIAVVISSNSRMAEAPGNVLLSRKASGLLKQSVANVSQLITINKAFLKEKVKRLGKREFSEVEEGLRFVLSLM